MPISRGLSTLIDDDDYDFVGKWRWMAQPAVHGTGKFYVSRGTRRGPVYLHRVLMKARYGQQVDHINRNPLDNRRSNLRLCTRSQNNINKIPRIGMSGFRGVHFIRKSKRWRSYIVYNGIQRTANFATAEEAAHHYDRMAREFHGEFAILNFPEETHD
jgi:hypothetical protein